MQGRRRHAAGVADVPRHRRLLRPAPPAPPRRARRLPRHGTPPSPPLCPAAVPLSTVGARGWGTAGLPGCAVAAPLPLAAKTAVHACLARRAERTAAACHAFAAPVQDGPMLATSGRCCSLAGALACLTQLQVGCAGQTGRRRMSSQTDVFIPVCRRPSQRTAAMAARRGRQVGPRWRCRRAAEGLWVVSRRAAAASCHPYTLYTLAAAGDGPAGAQPVGPVAAGVRLPYAGGAGGLHRRGGSGHPAAPARQRVRCGTLPRPCPPLPAQSLRRVNDAHGDRVSPRRGTSSVSSVASAVLCPKKPRAHPYEQPLHAALPCANTLLG